MPTKFNEPHQLDSQIMSPVPESAESQPDIDVMQIPTPPAGGSWRWDGSQWSLQVMTDMPIVASATT